MMGDEDLVGERSKEREEERGRGRKGERRKQPVVILLKSRRFQRKISFLTVEIKLYWEVSSSENKLRSSP